MTAADLRAEHGDPEGWGAQDFKDYFEIAAVEDWVRRHPIRARWSNFLVSLKHPFRRKTTEAPCDRIVVGNLVWTRSGDRWSTFGGWRVQHRTPHIRVPGWYVADGNRFPHGELLPNARSARDAVVQATGLITVGMVGFADTPAPVPDPRFFRDAAAALRTCGWLQGDVCELYTHDGCEDFARISTVGAIRIGPNGHPGAFSPHTDVAEKWLLERVLGKRYFDAVTPDVEGGYGDAVDRWNDEPGRTVDEVFAALESAAVLAEKVLAGPPNGAAE